MIGGSRLSNSSSWAVRGSAPLKPLAVSPDTSEVARFSILAVLVASLVLAGCGSSDSPGADAGSPAPRAAAPGGPLQVGATDGRLGDAITDSKAGREQRLSRGASLTPAGSQVDPRERDGIGAGTRCPHADLQPDATSVATIAEATLCMLNGERADRGMGALKLHNDLQRAALSHAGDMVERSFFSHTGRGGSQVADRIRAAGYMQGVLQWTVGENLAWGTAELGTPRAIVSAWMGSAGHRANILRAGYREIGLGVVAGNPGSDSGAGATYATEFGSVTRARARSVGSRRAVARRARARRAKARVALSPRGRRVVGRVSAAAGAGLPR